MSTQGPRRSARQRSNISGTETSGTDDIPQLSIRGVRSSRASDRQRGHSATVSRIVNLDVEVDVTPAGGSKRKRKSIRRQPIEEIEESDDGGGSEPGDSTFRSRETPRVRIAEQEDGDQDLTPRASLGKRRRVAPRQSLLMAKPLGEMPLDRRADIVADIARDCLTKLLLGAGNDMAESTKTAWGSLQCELYVSPTGPGITAYILSTSSDLSVLSASSTNHRTPRLHRLSPPRHSIRHIPLVRFHRPVQSLYTHVDHFTSR